MLTALYQPNRPAWIGLEHPELNIHPAAMDGLADCMAEVAADTQVLATTHSPELVNSLAHLRRPESLRVVSMADGLAGDAGADVFGTGGSTGPTGSAVACGP